MLHPAKQGTFRVRQLVVVEPGPQHPPFTVHAKFMDFGHRLLADLAAECSSDLNTCLTLDIQAISGINHD